MPTQSSPSDLRSRQEALVAAARAEAVALTSQMMEQLTTLVDAGPESAEADFGEEGGDPDVAVVERDRLRARLSVLDEQVAACDAALAALAAGTYGICVICDAEVPEERLEMLPTTTLCVACKAAGH